MDDHRRQVELDEMANLWEDLSTAMKDDENHKSLGLDGFFLLGSIAVLALSSSTVRGYMGKLFQKGWSLLGSTRMGKYFSKLGPVIAKKTHSIFVRKGMRSTVATFTTRISNFFKRSTKTAAAMSKSKTLASASGLAKKATTIGKFSKFARYAKVAGNSVFTALIAWQVGSELYNYFWPRDNNEDVSPIPETEDTEEQSVAFVEESAGFLNDRIEQQQTDLEEEESEGYTNGPYASAFRTFIQRHVAAPLMDPDASDAARRYLEATPILISAFQEFIDDEQTAVALGFQMMVAGAHYVTGKPFSCTSAPRFSVRSRLITAPAEFLVTLANYAEILSPEGADFTVNDFMSDKTLYSGPLSSASVARFLAEHKNPQHH